MKIKPIGYTLILLLLAWQPIFAETAKIQLPPKYTGTDWLLMSPHEKEASINSTLSFLKAKGIPIQKPAGFYGAGLNNVVDQPGAEKVEVTNLVTTLVYNSEPLTRGYIDQLRVKPAAKKVATPSKSDSKKKTETKKKTPLY